MEQIVKIKNVTKRSGEIAEFNFQKITTAIFQAAESVGGKDREMAQELARKVISKLEEDFRLEIITVDQIQNYIEKTLIDAGHAKTAKAFILYRYRKNEDRRRKAFILGNEQSSEDNLNFSVEALSVLKKRYLLKDDTGAVTETPKRMLQRVAMNIASADAFYSATPEEVAKTSQKFYRMMADLEFLPNTPTLMNAGTNTQQLMASFVMPIDDKMGSIFGTLRDAAVIHQKGGGTGFAFSRLRPLGDPVKKNLGVASGPVAFLKVYDAALDVIKQGGIRPGANMAVLRCDHPDIIRFIESKRSKKALKNFNISVGITDNFMRAVEENREYYVNNPHSGKRVGKLRARDVFAIITQNAWKTGDPGLVFLDEINRKHPAKHLGEIETTNQCAEAPLLPYEGCALGAINLVKFLKDDLTGMDWDALGLAVENGVHFLDNMIDIGKYPQKDIETATKRSRKLGLGIMGFADVLCSLAIKYDSEEGLEFAEKLISFIRDRSYQHSGVLASLRGPCLAWEGSEHQAAGRKMRNISCISLSPTGTRSILGGCSPGCEPLFAICYQGTILGGNELVYVNPIFEAVAKKRGFYSPELMQSIARFGSVKTLKEVP